VTITVSCTTIFLGKLVLGSGGGVAVQSLSDVLPRWLFTFISLPNPAFIPIKEEVFLWVKEITNF